MIFSNFFGRIFKRKDFSPHNREEILKGINDVNESLRNILDQIKYGGENQ